MFTHSRQYYTGTFLAIYLSCALFGQSVHLCQCTSPAESAAESSSDCGSCSCRFHTRRSESSDSETPSTPAEHDSDNCTVCLALALTEDRVTDLVGIEGSEALPESSPQVQIVAEIVRVCEVQSRGPPAA